MKGAGGTVKSIYLTTENQDVLSLQASMYLRSKLSTNSSQIKKMKNTLYETIHKDLTERQREMITMYYFDNMLMDDIAGKLGVTKGSVSITIKRGLNRIKKSKKIKKLLKAG